MTPTTRPTEIAATSRAGVLLRERLELAGPALAAVTARLWRPDGLAARYRVYLEVMYDVTRSSVPLMRRASRQCANASCAGAADPVTLPLRQYLDTHIGEEAGHDDWLREDLALLASPYAASAGWASAPAAVVARLVGAQYYWIEHYHPVTVLGYIAVMEATAPRPGVVDRVAAFAEVPDAALRTLREHADVDSGHAQAAFELLDTLDLSEQQAAAVALSGLHTAHGLVALYQHIIRIADAREDER